MTQKAGGPAVPGPTEGSFLEQVGYLGLTHFLRAKPHVGAAAGLVAQGQPQPDAEAVGGAMARFAKVTPEVDGGALVDYILALVERELAGRGVPVDPLVIYLLHTQLSRRQATAGGPGPRARGLPPAAGGGDGPRGSQTTTHPPRPR